jgi:hypothetical protein
MKLGLICDGVSRDLNHALQVMDEFELEYAELQFVGEKERYAQKLVTALIRRRFEVA